jgi:hypothetical protein
MNPQQCIQIQCRYGTDTKVDGCIMSDRRGGRRRVNGYSPNHETMRVRHR